MAATLIGNVRLSPPLFGGRYEVERELGSGGAATVFLANDTRLERAVALKVLREELAQALGQQRFLREIRFASQLRHPHIIPVLDYGELDGQLWYVMPHVAGGSLRHRLDREPQLKVELTVLWGAEIAEALAFAHQHGVVHRDVKPENILIDGDHALLADFGIARALNTVGLDTLTSAGIAIGTAAYMSPEQASGTQDIDGRSDVYSLSCVLYEALAGVPPFVGPTPQSVIAQRFAHAPHPLTSYRARVPQAVLDAIEGGMHIVAADRLDARELCTVLRAESTAEMRAIGRTGRTPKLQPSIQTIPESPPKQSRTRLRSLAVLLTTAVLASAYWISRPTLDVSKIVVFPLRVSGSDAVSHVPVGLAAEIGAVLEGYGGVTWEDGEHSSIQSNGDTFADSREERSRITRAAHAGSYLEGIITESEDSMRVILSLVRIEGDTSVILRARESGATGAGSPRTLVFAALSQLLPQIIDPGRRALMHSLSSKNSAAIAEFAIGEKEFRSSHYVEAVASYERAIALDSNFVEAALKAARSARSLFREQDAQKFVQIALAHPAALKGANESFARGLLWFYRQQPDSAISHLQRAIQLDPKNVELFAVLGDVYFYVGVDGVSADSAALDQYQRAISLDSTFTPVIYHLAWLAARRHDPVTIRKWLTAYQRLGSPDTVFSRAATLSVDCQTNGARSIDWKLYSLTSPASVEMLGKVLSGGAADLECSEAAFRSNFLKEGDPSLDQYGGLLGLNAINIVRGKADSARTLLLTPMARAMNAGLLAIADDLATGQFVAEADRAATQFMRQPATLRLEDQWLLTVWFARRGRSAEVNQLIRLAEAALSRHPEAADSSMFRSMLARRALMRRDTAETVRLLGRGTRAVAFSALEWGVFGSGAVDNLLLAEIALAENNPTAARRLAERVDRPNRILNVVFLRQSFSVRSRAAERMNDQPELQRLAARERQFLRRDIQQ